MAPDAQSLEQRRPRPMSLASSVLHFGVPTVGLFVTTYVGIPALTRLGVAPMLAWYAAGLAVFIPLFVTALVRSWREASSDTGARLERLWLRRPSRSDLVATGAALLAVAAGSGALFGGALWLARGLGLVDPSTTPPFLQGLDLARATGSPALLATWIVFFFFNILGEELFWRGYILPRQELAFGSRAWMVNGALWGLFHVSFGWSLVLMLSPLFFIAPWIVQRRRNVWLGVILHGVYNGVPSLLLALGLLG
jgi:membrane protease YdiL (CAAX protease family)